MTNTKNLDYDVLIDASGLICPLPILKSKQALSRLGAGDILKVIATDPTSELDFPVFAKATGNKILNFEIHDGLFVYYLLVKNE